MSEIVLASGAEKFRDPDWTAQARRAPPWRSTRCARCGSTPARSATSRAATATIESSPRTTGSPTSAGPRAFLFDEIEAERSTHRDRLHRRRAVHEPAYHRHGRRCAQARLRVLLLTNAMQPMQRPSIKRGLVELNEAFGPRLTCASASTITAGPCTRPSGARARGRHDRRGIDWLAAERFSDRHRRAHLLA